MLKEHNFEMKGYNNWKKLDILAGNIRANDLFRTVFKKIFWQESSVYRITGHSKEERPRCPSTVAASDAARSLEALSRRWGLALREESLIFLETEKISQRPSH